MRALTLLILCLALTSCKTKHKVIEHKRSESNLVATSWTDERLFYGRAIDAFTQLTESDILHVIIKDYHPDGSLARTTELTQGRTTERANRSKTQDSLQVSTKSEGEVKANETTNEARTKETEVKGVNVSSWLWIVVLLIALISCWRLARFLRL